MLEPFRSAVSASQAGPIVGPFGEIARAEPLGWPIVAVFADDLLRLEDVFFGTCTNEQKGWGRSCWGDGRGPGQEAQTFDGCPTSQEWRLR